MYRVGDTVRLKSDEPYTLAGHRLNYYIAKIEILWSKKNDDCMEVTWFYAPEDTEGGRKQRDGKRFEPAPAVAAHLHPRPAWDSELFHSNLSDTNAVETVVGHAMVVDKEYFDQWKAAQRKESGGGAAKKAGADPREPESWSLDWAVPANDARVPLFYYKRNYDVKRGKRSTAPWRMSTTGAAPKAAAAGAKAAERKRSRGAAAADSEATPQKRQRAQSASKRGRGGSARGGRRTSGGRAQTPSPAKGKGAAASGADASAAAATTDDDDVKSLKKKVAEARTAQRKAEKENQELIKEREKLRKLVSSIQGLLQ